MANPVTTNEDGWYVGRVGMLYRDLTPDSLRSRVVVSHIRLPFDGEVPDYVHYHKVDFQMIYCKKGRIKVVYEDQGEPFWLETGDCVLQPPEIRHRVLSAEAGAEVIEVTMPAEHETWVEHDVDLPTKVISKNRSFGGQIFHRHIARSVEWLASDVEGIECRDIGILDASSGCAEVSVYRCVNQSVDVAGDFESGWLVFPLDPPEYLSVRLNLAA